MTAAPMDTPRTHADETTRPAHAAAPSLIGGHRTDIEGLRAVAVVAVLLYHAGVTGFDGGYVGVDVFFALSGYLMTGLLVTEHRRTGHISLRAFYARRARRLLPASVLVLLVTTIASWFVLAPLVFENAAKDAMAAGSYVVNFRFAGQATDYLGNDVALSPVLHYWSLAVEEQFYAVWPLLLWLMLGRRRSAEPGHTRRSVIVLAAIAVVSFALAVRITATVQPWAFFGLHARAWEFAVGGLAAFATPHVARLGRSARIAIGWIGLGLIALAVFTFGATTRFPGPGAAIPVIGTVMVLLGGTVAGGAGSVLSPRPMQWIGGRSYAMYLWHWPALVLVPVIIDRPLTAWEGLGLVVLACVPAVLAHRLVEDPIRFSRRLAAAPWRNGALAACLTVTAVAVPWGLLQTVDLGGSDVIVAESPDGGVGTLPGDADTSTSTVASTSDGGTAASDTTAPPSTTAAPTTSVDAAVPVPANMLPSLRDVTSDAPAADADGCHLDQPSVEPLLPCAYGDLNAARTMVLFGDSHMEQWLPAFDRFGLDQGWKVVSLTKSACPSLTMTVFNKSMQREYTECDQWREKVFGLIAEMRPDLVVLGNYPHRASELQGQAGGPVADATWDGAMAATIGRLRDLGNDVLVMGPTPIPARNVPECVSGHIDDTRPCDFGPAKAISPDRIAAEQSVAGGLGATYIDVARWFCSTDRCPVLIGRYLVYRDKSHISTPFAAALALRLEQRFGELGLG